MLLSLIEATALASENVRQKSADSPRGDESQKEYGTIEAIRTMGSIVDDKEDAADDEERKIQFGTSLAGGVAGTYAVAVKDGLDIYPTRPTSMDDTSTQANEDVDNLVRYHHHDRKPSAARRGLDPPTGHTPPPMSPPSSSLHLSYGDRVQIVSVDQGWAKLSRGYGYVRAEGQNLVKGKNCGILEAASYGRK